MKKFLQKAISLVLGVTMALGLAAPAGAAFEDFKDVKGHWAEGTLRQAYTDGILKGYDAATMAPNNSVTTAEAVTVLCRVLHVTGKGDASAFAIPAGAWYKDEAAKAVYAGLLDESYGSNLNQPISRGDAFRLFGRAFQVTTADPDLSVLNQFADAAYLTGEKQRAAASLIEAGVVNGSEGRLQADRSLTRAEFASILYRLAGVYTVADSYQDNRKTGTVISGDADLRDRTAGDLWFDDSSAVIALTDVSASRVAIRSDRLDALSIQGAGTIDKLVLAARAGDVTLDLPKLCTVGTLTVGEGAGSVTCSGTIGRVEVTGSGRTIAINSSLDALVVSGSNNTLSLKNGCAVGKIIIRGTGNTLKLDGRADTLLLAGRDNTISGSGRVADVTLNTKYYKLNVSKGSLTDWTGYDLSGVEVRLDAPHTLPAGKVLKVTADLTVPEEQVGKLCTASWYLNGKLMDQEPVLLGKDTPVSAITPQYTHDMEENGVVEFVLSYKDPDGDEHTEKASADVKLENFADLGLADAVVTLSAPETLAAGETLRVDAVVDTPEVGKVCRGVWYVDGKDVASGKLTLGKSSPYLTFRYDYYYGMPETSTVELVVYYTTEDGRQQEVRGSTQLKVENFPDNGIARASASLNAPSVLEAGAALSVTADLKYPEAGKTCTGTWYVDGKQVSTQTIVLGKDTPKLSHKYTYTENMKLTSELKFVLTYTTEDGRAQQLSAVKTIQLKNYGYLHYHNMTEADVLNKVTSTYAGNYTLAWALKNDYKPEVKTAWVNLKGYSSKTKYLVWVNLTYQRVNIFEGSQGNWKLIRQCLCGTGKPSTPTIKGVFTTSYKQSAWNYGSYYCGPIVRFNGSSGYAFHSRLEYWPMNSDRYYDARIGFPISHGCLRMYNDDIWFMYNNIPNGTTVVVH